MNIVLIHIGDKLPSYFWDCCEQVRRWYGGDIHVVIPRGEMQKNAIKRIGVHPVACENLMIHGLYKKFEKVCYLNGFWNVTLGRLFLLQILMMNYKLTDVVHIENDVLIYRDPEAHLFLFRKLGASSALMAPVGPNHASAAYMYVKDWQILNRLNRLFIEYFESGKESIREKFGKTDVNEMELMCYFQKHHLNVIHYLPITPTGQWSFDYAKFKSLFDGASAGQFIGGTQTDGPGWAGDHHYLGAELLKGKYQFVWADCNKGKVPYMCVSKNGQATLPLYIMNNLHIHSKKLIDFM